MWDNINIDFSGKGDEILTIYRIRDYAMKVFIFVASAAVIAVAMNGFFIPNNIFSGGFNGVAQLLSLFFAHLFGLQVQVGTLILLFNIPIAIVGWVWAGRKFTILSFLNNFLASAMQIAMPKVTLVHDEPLLAALFGGLLIGVAIGFTFKMGFSTGGMDIVAMVVQKTTGRSIGFINMFINAIIVVIAGAFIGWQNAMYTIIGIYATSVAIDQIYTRHRKLTAFIVTRRSEEVAKALQDNLIRGITIIPSVGAYTHEPSSTLMMVLSRYELADMQRVAKTVDPDAFINVINTIQTSENFFNEDLQSQLRRERLAAQAQLNDALNIEEAADKLVGK
jgi:uncharacterized membrane-anchored protein YitT (DUF2179 family)